jgi:hypothetical protein
MSTYTPPALNAVDFALTAATVPDLTPAEQALSVYTPPALNAVDFALTAFTPPTYPYVGWELLPDAGADADILGAGQIASAEAFGGPTIAAVIASAGIVTAEAFGDASIQAQIYSAGIVTGEQFGEPLVEAVATDAEILMAGIPSEEAFGSPQIYVRRRTSGGVQTPTPKPDLRRREWLRVQAKIRAEDEELLSLSAHAVASLMQEVELWEA